MIEMIPFTKQYTVEEKGKVFDRFKKYVETNPFNETRNPKDFIELYKTIDDADTVCLTAYLGNNTDVLAGVISDVLRGNNEYDDAPLTGNGIAMCYKLWQEGSDPFPGISAEHACRTLRDILKGFNRVECLSYMAPVLFTLGMNVLTAASLDDEDTLGYLLGTRLFLGEGGEHKLKSLKGAKLVNIISNFMRKHPVAYAHLAFRHDLSVSILAMTGSILYSLER